MFVCGCARAPARWWWVGAKMQGLSNVNYSGLGHLLCNSKMSQRYMPCLCTSCGKTDIHVLGLWFCVYTYIHTYFFGGRGAHCILSVSIYAFTSPQTVCYVTFALSICMHISIHTSFSCSVLVGLFALQLFPGEWGLMPLPVPLPCLFWILLRPPGLFMAYFLFIKWQNLVV